MDIAKFVGGDWKKEMVTLEVNKNNNMQNFEQWLQEQFMKGDGETCNKDNCEDMFDGWLSNLDGEEYIKFADSYCLEMVEVMKDKLDLDYQTLKEKQDAY